VNPESDLGCVWHVSAIEELLAEAELVYKTVWPSATSDESNFGGQAHCSQ